MQIQLPRVGEVVDGKYQLEETIGEGGFARVFRATDLLVGRSVAVKVLKPGDTGYAVTVASRFAREARALAGLSDAHTLRLFDFGRTEGGVLYMVSELLGGRDLRDLLNRRSLDEREAVHVMRQLLSSLREAHSVGILHRDIKPSNIQVFEHLDDDLRVKLIDFGIARPTGPEAAKITQTGAVIGTPRYMSPEQAVGSPLTASSDLFSLGLVMLEILTGDPRAPLQAVLAGRSLELPASDHLRAVLERMLDQQPARRFTNADDVLAALDAPRSQPVSVEPSASSRSYTSDSGGHASHPISQAPTHERAVPLRLLAVAGIAVVVVVFGLGVLALSSREERDPPPRTVVPAQRVVSPIATTSVPTPDPVPEEVTAPERDMSPDTGPLPSGCGKKHAPGAQKGSHSEGWARVDWTAWVPRRYDPTEQHALVMLIHGSDGEAKDLLLDGGASKVADRGGFVAVAPQGNDTWSFEDEGSGTFRVIIDQMIQTYCIDESRIFVIGHDTAGAAAERLSCEPWVRGAASTSWRPRRERTPCDTPKARFIFSPLKSLHLPIGSGTQCVGRQVFSVQKFEEVWEDRNKCSGKPRRTFKRGGSECWAWDCEEPLASCHVNGGHNWRGMTPRRFDILDCDGEPAKFDYTAAAWKFFDGLEGS